MTTALVLVAAVVLAASPWWAGPGRRATVAGRPSTAARQRGPRPALGLGWSHGDDPRPGRGLSRETGPGRRRGRWSGRRGTRRGSRSRAAEPGTGLLLVLVEAALGSGVPVARALEVVGAAWPGADGAHLARAARRLAVGTDWSTAWRGAAGGALAVARALEPTWASGAAAGPMLRAAADSWSRQRRAAARTAAARLGVHLLLPTGLCLLPAFVLLGVVPMVLALADGLLG